MAKPKKNTPQVEDALAALTVLTAYLTAQAGEDGVTDTEVADESNEDSTVAAERARLEALGVRALRAEAKEAGFDPADVKSAGKDELVESLLEHFASDDDEDDAEDDDEDEDEDDEVGEDEDEGDDGEDEDAGEYTESDLSEMSLGELKKALKELGWTAADLKGKSQDDLVAEYGEEIGFAESDADEDEADDDDDEDESDDDEDADDEDDDDDDEDAIDEDALKAMDLAELKALAKEYGVTVPKGVKKPALIELILDEAGEEEDDDDEPDF